MGSTPKKKRKASKYSKGSRKGSEFERDLCKQLSVWITLDPEKDDLFWRTAASGGRASVRAKKQKQTAGQYGDIQATSKRGRFLTRFVTIEAKTGYPRCSIAEVVDNQKLRKPAMYKDFFGQAERESKQAGTDGWFLIARRRSHRIMLFMPMHIAKRINRAMQNLRGATMKDCYPHCTLTYLIKKDPVIRVVFGLPFDLFLKHVKPDDIEHAYRSL